MHIYAGFIQAMQFGMITTTPFYTTNARSLEEANGIGYRLARENFPQDEGWTNHHGMAMPITEVVRDTLDNPLEPSNG